MREQQTPRTIHALRGPDLDGVVGLVRHHGALVDSPVVQVLGEPGAPRSRRRPASGRAEVRSRWATRARPRPRRRRPPRRSSPRAACASSPIADHARADTRHGHRPVARARIHPRGRDRPSHRRPPAVGRRRDRHRWHRRVSRGLRVRGAVAAQPGRARYRHRGRTRADAGARVPSNVPATATAQSYAHYSAERRSRSLHPSRSDRVVDIHTGVLARAEIGLTQPATVRTCPGNAGEGSRSRPMESVHSSRVRAHRRRPHRTLREQ